MWSDVQDAVVAALVDDAPTGWTVRPEAGFPGMSALDEGAGGLIWVDDGIEESTFEGIMTAADGGVEPVGETFPVVVNAYRASAVSRKALRDDFAALELDLLTTLLGHAFVTGPGYELVLSKRSYRPGMLDDSTWDGLYVLTFTWRG